MSGDDAIPVDDLRRADEARYALRPAIPLIVRLAEEELGPDWLTQVNRRLEAENRRPIESIDVRAALSIVAFTPELAMRIGGEWVSRAKRLNGILNAAAHEDAGSWQRGDAERAEKLANELLAFFRQAAAQDEGTPEEEPATQAPDDDIADDRADPEPHAGHRSRHAGDHVPLATPSGDRPPSPAPPQRPRRWRPLVRLTVVLLCAGGLVVGAIKWMRAMQDRPLTRADAGVVARDFVGGQFVYWSNGARILRTRCRPHPQSPGAWACRLTAVASHPKVFPGFDKAGRCRTTVRVSGTQKKARAVAEGGRGAGCPERVDESLSSIFPGGVFETSTR